MVTRFYIFVFLLFLYKIVYFCIIFTKLIMLGVKYFGGNMVIFCQVLGKNRSH